MTIYSSELNKPFFTNMSGDLGVQTEALGGLIFKPLQLTHSGKSGSFMVS